MFKDLLNTVKNYALIPWMGMLSDQLYQFLPSKDGYSLKASTNLSRIKYILLSREHYHEIQKDYPVESRKELDKIVKLELATKTDDIVLYRIGEYKNKKRIVTFAEINANIHSYFQHAYWLLCIPESWLISSIFEHQLVKVESKVAPYWLYSTGEKITSHAIKGLFSASSAFCAAVGISDNNKPVQLSKNQVIDLFLNNSFKFLTVNFKGVLVTKKQMSSFNYSDLLPGIIAFVSVFIIYNFSTTLYLENHLANLQSEQKTLIKKAGRLFLLQKKVKSKADKVVALNNTLFVTGVPLTVWQDLLPLFENPNLQFKNISVLSKNHVVRFMAEAPKATAILEQISQLKNIENAHFYTDVVQIKDVERFTIVYKYLDKKTPMKVEKTDNG